MMSGAFRTSTRWFYALCVCVCVCVFVFEGVLSVWSEGKQKENHHFGGYAMGVFSWGLLKLDVLLVSPSKGGTRRHQGPNRGRPFDNPPPPPPRFCKYWTVESNIFHVPHAPMISGARGLAMAPLRLVVAFVGLVAFVHVVDLVGLIGLVSVARWFVRVAWQRVLLLCAHLLNSSCEKILQNVMRGLPATVSHEATQKHQVSRGHEV